MIAEITRDELKEILALIGAQYGIDFSGYAEASLKRRICHFAGVAGVSLFDLKYHLTNDRDFFQWMQRSLTVNVTEMFRDPTFYRAVAEHVLPVLATYPAIKIWHAGCATGEEAFSLAILLQEAGLLKRTRIYATDINPQNLEKAVAGIVPLNGMKEYTANYQKAGGKREFADYYTARYDNVIMSKELRDSILFSQHNLVTDYVFNEFQLILCRNVLIYFKKELQNRVLNLLHDSLSPLGFLALGTKESLLFTDCSDRFETVNAKEKIFRARE